MQYRNIPELNNCEAYFFDSLSEMCDEVYKIRNKDTQIKGCFNRHEDTRSIKWTGRRFRTAEDYKDFPQQEWEEGIKWYDEMMKELQKFELPQPKSLRRKRVWSEDEGDEVNLDRLQRGQAFWNTTHRDHRPGPLSITIVIDMSTRCGFESKEIIWRGIAAICLTQILEKAGYRVELWAANYASPAYGSRYDTSGANHACCVKLKDASDPIDVSTLINAVSGWCYRTIWFGAISLSDKSPHGGCGTYPRDTNQAEPIVKYITEDENALLVSGVFSASKAIDWVRQQLADKFDCPLT